MPVPYCLDDCGFVVETEVRQVDTSSRELNSANNLNELDADPSPELPKSHTALVHLDFVFVNLEQRTRISNAVSRFLTVR